MNKKEVGLSRRKFIGDSAKALTGLSVARIKLPMLLFGGQGLLHAVSGCDTADRAEGPAAMDLDADAIGRAFAELPMDTPAGELYEIFNQFCLTHFGAEVDPVVYETFGTTLAIEEGSRWNHYSERSAAIAWSTTLPARSFIEYGPTTSYGSETGITERYFYTHLHYLKNLEPDTRYHYRIVSVDERGNRVVSEDQKFQTRTIPDAIPVPGNMFSPPYILDRSGGHYVITEDIHVPRTAFEIAAEDITIDLGGHTVTHGNELIDDLDYTELSQSGVGIRRRGGAQAIGLRIFNGTIKQGEAENNQEYYAADDMLSREPADRHEKLLSNMSRGFSNIEISNYGDVEIAGVTAEHRWHQIWGMRFDEAFGTYDIHHNVFLDKGIQMFSRHGDGTVRSVGFRNQVHDDTTPGNDIRFHHNLVKRIRQNAFNGAQKNYNNEVYVDSWVVNAFAISPYRDHGQVVDNKIFMTGYYACGVVWADRDLNVSNNFIHMESVSTMINPPYEGRRLIETWGEQDVLIALRLTNYGTGGQERTDFTYDNNVIFGRSRGDVIMRGIALYSDHSVRDFLLKNNKIKILTEDLTVEKAACVVTQGANNDRSEHLPMYYEDNLLESDICNIRFGDEYGRGSNHRFIKCRIVKLGNNPNYHTFVFDGGNSVFNHVLHDCNFIDGAAYDDVYWINTRSNSNYRIDWTLEIETDPDADIIIRDKNGQAVYTGTSGRNGQFRIPLTQSTIRPVEWTLDGEEVEVEEKSDYQEERLSPYTISVVIDGEEKSTTVEMDQKRTLNI